MSEFKMRIMILDDEPYVMEEIHDLVKQVEPDADIMCFSHPQKAMECLKTMVFHVLFLDIEMGMENGIDFGKKVKALYPQVNLVFVTGYSQYATNAMRLRASGYVLKPPTLENIREEMENLRHPVFDLRKKGLFIQCFGNFEVFWDGEPMRFKRKRTKELFAYLVDRKGALVTSGEAISVLFENDENENSNRSYCRNLIADLKTTLQKYGMEDILIKSFQNSYGIRADKVLCDYYLYLQGDPGALRNFNGEYMTQYSWAEATLASLTNI